jgi:hypothetical protein
VGDGTRGSITENWFHGVTSELRAKSVIGKTREISAKILAFTAIGKISAQQALDGGGNFSSGATEANGPRDALIFADGATHAEVICVNQFTMLFDFFPFEANVGNPVLAAGVGASGYVELERLVETRDAVLEILFR